MREEDGNESIKLNDYIIGKNALIKEIEAQENCFLLGEIEQQDEFSIKVFKIYSPGKQRSKISLVAHQREVTETPIHNYIPEFAEEFYDKFSDGTRNQDRNFIIKAYVFGEYLNDNVSLERGDFTFGKVRDLYHPIGQKQIEEEAAKLTSNAMVEEVSIRKDKKQKQVIEYVEQQAPWHIAMLKDLDFSTLPFKASDEEIELELQKVKIHKESSIRSKITAILENSGPQNSEQSVQEVIEQISETSKNDLVHYVASRRQILDFFRRNIEKNQKDKYSAEGLLHDIIFPRKEDSKSISYDNHNLWITDERLNFTSYLSSDLPLKGKSDRPDIISYNKRVAFRGDNVTSNPVTIFEFKKPGRDDFANPSSKEDPVEQIIRYVNKIVDGKFKTPKGLNIKVTENTPFYGYIVFDVSKKIEHWLERQKGFKPLPDAMGWFRHEPNINLYMEALSWEKLLEDADMRNRIFFSKLGI